MDDAAELMIEPIDVVYTWVTMDDERWQTDFAEWSRRERPDGSDDNIAPSRYRDNQELRFSLRSLNDHADWVRHVWVVTAGQRPQWLIENQRLTVVDHREILSDKHLPTFNSHVIESALHRIDALAEHFIYFNDDMFLGRTARPEQFFTSSGLPYVFASRGRVPTDADEEALAVDTAARNVQRLLAERFGRRPTFKPLHAPYALRRSTMHEMEAEFESAFEQTRSRRFRSPDDVSTAANLALYYGVLTGRGVVGEIDNEYISGRSGRLGWHLDRLRRSRRFTTFCVNDFGTDTCTALKVECFLEEYFPVPSPWEQP